MRAGTLVVGMLLASATALPTPGAAAAPTGHVEGVVHSAVHAGGSWTLTDALHDGRGADVTATDPHATAEAAEPWSGDVASGMRAGVFGSQRALEGGDYTLPYDRRRWPDGTADIAQVRLRLRDGGLAVVVEFDALPIGSGHVATVTFASGEETRARPWPRGAGVSGPWSVAVTVTPEGTFVQRPSGAERRATTRSHGTLIEAIVPLTLLPHGDWRVTVGSGLSDPADPTHYWTVPPGPATATTPGTGGPPSTTAVWDLALAGDWYPFGDMQQAAILASGDVTAAASAVDRSALRAGATVGPAAQGPTARVFTSRWDGGDGVDRDPSGVLELGSVPRELPYPDPGPGTAHQYTGRLQSYGLQLPAGTSARTPAPLLVYLHGFGGGTEEPFEAFPGFVDALSKRGWVVVAPHGRGDRFYRPGPGELDVLEVIADVRRHHAIDADRVFLMGMSGGAAGVNTVSSRHPDLFAGLVAITPTYEEPDLVENVVPLPWLGIMGEADPVSQLLDGAGLYEALSLRGAEATLVRYAARTHEFSLVHDSVDRIIDFLERHRRQVRPTEVTWTAKPGDDVPELGLLRDGAWWLDGVEAANAGRAPYVHVRSAAFGVVPADPMDADRQVTLTLEGEAGSRPVGRVSTTVPAPAERHAPRNLLTVTASNVASLTIDADGAGLTLDRPLWVEGSTDAPLRVTLVAGRRTISLGLPLGSSRQLVRSGRS